MIPQSDIPLIVTQWGKFIKNFTMSTAAPVIPYPANLLYDEQELHRFLSACQQTLPGTVGSQIVSFSQKIDPIDPLAVLESIVPLDQLHFYWENRRNNESIIAYGISKSLTLDSPDRFSKGQIFIEDCFKQTLRIGALDCPGSGPHLFCSFTFFACQKNGRHPFPAATIFLPHIQISRKKDDFVLGINLAINHQTNLQILLEKLRNELKLIFCSNRDRERNLNSRKKIPQSAQIYPSYNFTAAVTSALESIEKNQFSKIVLAHAIDAISPVPFKIVDSLSNLRQHHPDCYIFSTNNGQGQTFIGASPERLISIQNQQLITDALAGSAPRGKTPLEDANFAQKLLRNEKERREHQSVSQFISQRLCQLGLTPQQSPLKLLQLSNIQHLWTPIYAQVRPPIHPLEIVAKLHPTPAVAGVPTEIACEQIRHYETFDRSLYAAPLGWIDYQGNSEFIVGIRSALIEGNHARLYAGAGIVAGSNPEKELTEIQLKFQALLKALRVI
jgi:menaquinone-specific isochorismate synthase